jgi:autotransporter translocation and assembly factor TamB
MLPDPLQGSAFGSGPVTIKNRKISTDLKLEVKDVRSAKFSVGSGNVALKATKDLDALLEEKETTDPEAAPAGGVASSRAPPQPPTRKAAPKDPEKGVEPSAAPIAAALEENDKEGAEEKQQPFWQGLDVQVSGNVQDFKSESFSADSAKFDATVQNDQVNLREVAVEKNGNRITASGGYKLPRDPKDIDAGASDIKVKIDAPSLGDFSIKVAGATLSGHLSTDADLKMVRGTMNGTVSIDGKDFSLGDFRAESLQGEIQVANDLADIQQLVLRIDAQNTVTVAGTARVKKPITYDATLQARLNQLATLEPLLAVFGTKEKLGGAFHADWSGKGDVSTGVHAGKLTSEARQVIYGATELVEAQLGGTYDMREQQIAVDASLLAKQVSGLVGADSAEVKLTGTKKLKPEEKNVFAGLESKVTASIDNGRFQKITVDAVRLDAEVGNQVVTVRELRVTRAENRITAQGTYKVPQELDDANTAPIDAQFEVAVPKLSDFGVEVAGQTLSGRLAASGNVQVENNAYTGGVQIDGGDFKIGGFTARRLAGKIAVANNVADIQQLALQINNTDQLAVVGEVGLLKPHAYEAALLVDIKSLANLQPLLAVFDVKEPFAGALKIDWKGKGEAAANEHTGDLSLALRKGRYGKLDLSEITIAGLYGPGFGESTAFRAVTGLTSFEAGISFAEGKLRIKDINLQQARMPVLSGFVVLPFEPGNREQMIPLEKRIAANINLNQLDIAKLMTSLGKESAFSGTVTANLLSGGTLLRPTAHLKIAARGLKTKAAAKFAAAEVDAVAHFSNNELTLDSTLRQPQIQPLTIKGQAPLNLQETVEKKQLDPNMPVALTVSLPKSSLAFVPNLTPAVRRIDGTAGVDVRVAGTVGKPVLSGSATIDIRSARMTNDNVPAIGGFNANLAFADDTLRFNRFGGEIGGGTFGLGGSVKLEKLTEPVFDLRFQSDEVLVKRDDTITVRVDTDVRLTGPLAAATASGNVFLVHSRFFKEIDIMPIALPGRPKPVPKEVRQETNVSFPEPPLRDMKFDIAIKTRPEDPFLIRGNLANGSAIIDLKLTGTGLEPLLEGAIRVDQFTARLPFRPTLRFARFHLLRQRRTVPAKARSAGGVHASRLSHPRLYLWSGERSASAAQQRTAAATRRYRGAARHGHHDE